MISQKQIEELSSYFQIDKTIIFREYLQIVFLNYLYQEKKSEKIYFKGGTCLRLLYNSPRFSEDLDFSTILPIAEIKKITGNVTAKMRREIADVNLILRHSGRKSLRYKIRYDGKEFKYALTIGLDFAFEKIILKAEVKRLKTEFPAIFSPLVLSLSKAEILAEKIRAFLIRAKGRDIFDLWYLLTENLYLRENVLNKKLKSANLKFNKDSFLKKIKNYSQNKLEADLSRFLPKHYRKIIPNLKQEVVRQSENLLKL